MYELPMFPLEQAVLPTGLIPLHIFEPRYRELARAVTTREEPEFGTALIERGREVGGDDQRVAVGVVARVVRFEEFPDGRWAIAAVATRRIRINEWLTDDPYPRALITDWPDDDAEEYRSSIDPQVVAAMADDLDRISSAAARLEPGRPSRPSTLSDDPAHATWQAAIAAGLGPLDGLRLLREPAAGRRAAIAAELIADRAEMLEALADQAG